ncbi:MAG: DUF2249 domain-containing protein [Verrucomicrobia bacterium]|nr:DUF2249 domain-containing protein [Verrucomicrobiota bacterium]
MNAVSTEHEARPMSPRLLDTRPIFAAGQAPCQVIDDAVAALAPGQPFESIPLYAKLGSQGFSHRAEQLPDGSWRAEFRKSG